MVRGTANQVNQDRGAWDLQTFRKAKRNDRLASHAPAGFKAASDVALIESQNSKPVYKIHQIILSPTTNRKGQLPQFVLFKMIERILEWGRDTGHTKD